MKASNIVLGILAGAAVGAVLGVLFAPDKGSNTRKKITRKGEDMVEDLKAKANLLAEEANHLARQANRLVDKVGDSVQSVKRDAGALADNTKAKISEVIHNK